MGLFSFLLPQPFYIGDAVFGRLRREEYDRHTGQTWFITEALLFAPTGRRIGCYLDTPETGPTAAQQVLYRHIEQQYDTLIAKLIPLIEDEFRNWQPDFCIADFGAEFWLTGISIPELQHPSTEPAWDWTFETIHDANHMFTFYMNGDTPLPGMQMDG
ncbi:hypothetical protein MON38_17775 [Hymenobacter sp. DH14]|uniref:Uncharacterized protein n=1 Tax=Hymenobacter cyanobacteriorum TaxID=2926463 RepID=A0A9X2AHU3_9BACT|nr:hypothetical protein [Hymenobacter cyanobacteriorum]MCI1189278.1 hypothetical protein [Hymenobacter cyanobacteriorum]